MDDSFTTYFVLVDQTTLKITKALNFIYADCTSAVPLPFA